MHTNTIKAFFGLPSRGPTHAIIHSPEGLGFPRISDLYLESHTLAFARCEVKADDRVVHALKSKLGGFVVCGFGVGGFATCWHWYFMGIRRLKYFWYIFCAILFNVLYVLVSVGWKSHTLRLTAIYCFWLFQANSLGHISILFYLCNVLLLL